MDRPSHDQHGAVPMSTSAIESKLEAVRRKLAQFEAVEKQVRPHKRANYVAALENMRRQVRKLESDMEAAQAYEHAMGKGD